MSNKEMDQNIEHRGRIYLNQVLNGHRPAYRHFIRLYERLVFSIAARLISCSEDRDDICQDVFIKAYQNLEAFRGDSKISTWLGKITYNTCINYLRRKKLAGARNGISQKTIDEFESLEMAPDQSMEKQDIAARLKDEILRLPPQLQTALTLFHMQGMKYDEIAEIMGLPEGTVKSHLYRARQMLKKRLLEKYQEEELML